MGSPSPRRSRPTTDDQQYPLPFDRTPEIVLFLRRIDQRATLTESPKLFRQWKQFAIAVDFLKGRAKPPTWQEIAKLASEHEPGLVPHEKKRGKETEPGTTFKRAPPRPSATAW